MKLNKGDYIDLRGMELDKKQEIADWLEEKGISFLSGKAVEEGHSCIICDQDGDLLKSYSIRVDLYGCKTDRTADLLHEMSLSSANVQETKPKLPEKFKVRNGNDPLVKKWLAENYTDKVGTGGITLYDIDREYLFFNHPDVSYSDSFSHAYLYEDFAKVDLPELILHTGVVGWEIKPSKKDKLEQRIEELELELKKAKEELKSL